VRVRGSMDSMAGVVFTDAARDSMAVDLDIMVAAGSGITADSAAALPFAGAADSAALVRRAEVAAFTVEAASMVVAGSTEAADPTVAATGSCDRITLSHEYGWRPWLPAVFF